MTKEELRADYISKGWTVDPIFITISGPDGDVQQPNWKVVSNVDGVVKYDVNVISPENRFGTAQVVVTDDNGAGESAVADGFWVDKVQPITFEGELKTYLETIEASAQVFAVAVTLANTTDEIAECKAYMEDGSVKNYVVKRRNDTFTHKELI